VSDGGRARASRRQDSKGSNSGLWAIVTKTTTHQEKENITLGNTDTALKKPRIKTNIAELPKGLVVTNVASENRRCYSSSPMISSLPSTCRSPTPLVSRTRTTSSSTPNVSRENNYIHVFGNEGKVTEVAEEEHESGLLIVDSLQTAHCPNVKANEGSPSQCCFVQYLTTGD